jgi:large subunit ribosomal protein L25
MERHVSDARSDAKHDDSHIQAEPRTEFGKGAARRIRRADKVPAVLYGHGGKPTHISMPGHETMLALKHGGVNALLTITVDGKEQLALPKQIQRDPIKGFLEHLDLIIVRKGEKVTVDIPVHVHGEPDPEALVVTETSSISVEAEATNIPEYVEVSIEGLTVGDQVLAKDLQVPEGSRVLLDGEALIINVTHAPTAEELEEELAEAEAEAGIEREESEEEGEGAEGEGAEAAEGADGDGSEAEADKPAEE